MTLGDARALVFPLSRLINIAGGVVFKPGGDTFDALLGIGLIGLFDLPNGGSGAVVIFGVVVSLSSSELECFLRVPAQAGD